MQKAASLPPDMQMLIATTAPRLAQAAISSRSCPEATCSTPSRMDHPDEQAVMGRAAGRKSFARHIGARRVNPHRGQDQPHSVGDKAPSAHGMSELGDLRHRMLRPLIHG